VFYTIGERRDIVIIKNDGVREQNQFTVVISSPKERFPSIRCDDSALSHAMKKALIKYIEMES